MLRLDAYNLKWIAIIGMTLNHAVFAMFEVLPTLLTFPLYAAGGLTFPILAFFVVEGYKHTSNIKKYILRLFVFGLISIPFHMLVFRSYMTNILFTIILSLIILILHDKIMSRLLFWVIFIFLLLVSVLLMMDWFLIGPIVVLLYYKIQNENARRIVPSFVSGIFFLCFSLFGIFALTHQPEIVEMLGSDFFGDINYWYASSTFIIGCVAAGFLLKGYNGERGKKMKWLFYAAYPIHLAVLGGIALALGLVDLSVFGL